MTSQKLSLPAIVITMQSTTHLSNQLTLTPEFKQALEQLINSTHHIYLTGKAGTGKSTLLSYFRSQTKKKLAVLAPTGVAAINIKGETIHSFFRFKSNITVEDAYKQALNCHQTTLFEQLDAIVIDEISMVRADLIDCMDIFLKTILNNHQDFGGIQMIWVGDLHQLPPIVSREEYPFFKKVYTSPYFFSSRVVRQPHFNLEKIELSTIYRQQQSSFIDLLNAIRFGTISQDQLESFNQLTHRPVPTDFDPIYLTTTNSAAQHINQSRLDCIDDDPFYSTATYSKQFDKKLAPTEEELVLKVGAQVMFVNNHSAGIWVNGTIGKVVFINHDQNEIIVRLSSGIDVPVSPHKWQMYKYCYDEEQQHLTQKSAGSFTQFPLKLAWAITIHKSQGKTFDSVVIDFGSSTFAAGQVYVALSRCRDLNNIILTRPLRRSDIILDRTIQEWETQYFL